MFWLKFCLVSKFGWSSEVVEAKSATFLTFVNKFIILSWICLLFTFINGVERQDRPYPQVLISAVHSIDAFILYSTKLLELHKKSVF